MIPIIIIIIVIGIVPVILRPKTPNPSATNIPMFEGLPGVLDSLPSRHSGATNLAMILERQSYNHNILEGFSFGTCAANSPTPPA